MKMAVGSIVVGYANKCRERLTSHRAGQALNRAPYPARNNLALHDFRAINRRMQPIIHADIS